MKKNKYVIKGIVNNHLVYFMGLKDEIIWDGEEWQVRQLSKTLNCATKYNSYDEALYVIRECELSGFDAYPVCPICGKDYDGYPAISRADNKTEICSECGTHEALNIFYENYYKEKD